MVAPLRGWIAYCVFAFVAGLLLADRTFAEEITKVEVTIEMESADPDYGGIPKSWDKPEGESVKLDILYGNRIVGSRAVGGGERWLAKPVGADETARKLALKRVALHSMGDLAVGLIGEQIQTQFETIAKVSAPRDLLRVRSAWEAVQQLQSALHAHKDALHGYQLENPQRPDIRYLQLREQLTQFALINSAALRDKTIAALEERRAKIAGDDPAVSLLQDTLAMLRETNDAGNVADIADIRPTLPPPVKSGGVAAVPTGAYSARLASLSRQAENLARAIDARDAVVRSIAEKIGGPNAGNRSVVRDVRSNISSAASSHAARFQPSISSDSPIASAAAQADAPPELQDEYNQAIQQELEIRAGIDEYVQTMQQVRAPLLARFQSFRNSVDTVLESSASGPDRHVRRLDYTNRFIENVEDSWRRHNRVSMRPTLLTELEMAGEVDAGDLQAYRVLTSLLDTLESGLYTDEYRHRFEIPLLKPIPAWNVDNAYVRLASPNAEGWRFRVSVIGKLDEPSTARVVPVSSTTIDDADRDLEPESTDSWFKAELLLPDAVMSMGGELPYQPPGRHPPNGDPANKHKHETEHMWRFQRME